MNVNKTNSTVDHFFVEMVSFHELQELFLFSHSQGILDDEELLLLYEEYSPKNPDFCYENFGRFSLDDINDAECLAEFRFRKHDLPLLPYKKLHFFTLKGRKARQISLL